MTKDPTDTWLPLAPRPWGLQRVLDEFEREAADIHRLKGELEEAERRAAKAERDALFYALLAAGTVIVSSALIVLAYSIIP